MKITFLGGAGCVTGSRHLVEAAGTRLLVDCGLFQGYKHLRLRNWEPFPAEPASIDAVVLTHAHIDHSGYLPALVRDGFRGRILCSPATRDLAAILLADSAKLNQEDARRANRGRYSKHRPAKPLYRSQDAAKAIRQFTPLNDGDEHSVGPVTIRLTPNGHILGSTMALLDDGTERVLFSGDVGRAHDILMPPPQPLPACDRLVLESTYGARTHQAEDVEARMEAMLRRVAETRGVLLVPSFAVGRAQAVAWLMHKLMAAGRAPQMPVMMDSPLSQKACRVLSSHPDLTRLPRTDIRDYERRVRHVSTPDQSRALARKKGPFVLISSSGMLTGGRAVNHMESLAPHARNTLLFVGYQAGGTRGARIMAGDREVKAHGRMIPIKCKVESLQGLSGHADGPELIEWLGALKTPPKETYLVHGEPESADALRSLIQERLGWNCRVPVLGESAPAPGAKQDRRSRR